MQCAAWMNKLFLYFTEHFIPDIDFIVCLAILYYFKSENTVNSKQMSAITFAPNKYFKNC